MTSQHDSLNEWWLTTLCIVERISAFKTTSLIAHFSKLLGSDAPEDEEMPWFGTSKFWLVGAWSIATSGFLDEESVTLLWSLFVWRVLPLVQKANIVAEELFWPSEFRICLTDWHDVLC